MAITRRDIARAAGVSPAVVSYVINNGPRPVSAAARARVTSAIERLGYRPNAIASALRAGTSHSIGLLVPGLQNPQFGELAEAIERSFSARSYLVLTGSTHNARSREQLYLRTFVDRKADAVILGPGVALSRESARELAGTPVLIIDDVAPPPGASAIRLEQTADAAYAVEHLQRHGHVVIGCICGPSNVTFGSAPAEGWRRSQRGIAAPHGDELIAHAENSESGGNTAAQSLLSARGRPWAMHGSRPTALFVASDAQALGALHACYQLGLSVPDDVSIVSLGGTQLASYSSPPLTSMRKDIDSLATWGCEHLLARISDPATMPLRMSMQGNLVIGRSCGC